MVKLKKEKEIRKKRLLKPKKTLQKKKKNGNLGQLMKNKIKNKNKKKKKFNKNNKNKLILGKKLQEAKKLNKRYKKK